MARTHTVKSGDTLSKIAKTYYGDGSFYKELAVYNGIANPNAIKVGQVLKIPAEAQLKGDHPEPVRVDHGVVRPRGLDQIIQTFGEPREETTTGVELDKSWERSYMGRAKLGFNIPLSWDKNVLVGSIYCHKKLTPAFEAAFGEIAAVGLEKKVFSYGGCFNFRVKRRSERLSTHSWGIAIDLNTEDNLMGTEGKMDPGLVKIFQRHGFEWGGGWSGTKDPMHFQYCTGY